VGLAAAAAEVHNPLNSSFWYWVKEGEALCALVGWIQQFLGAAFAAATTFAAKHLLLVEPLLWRVRLSFAMVIEPKYVIWSHTNWSGRLEVKNKIAFASHVSDTATCWMTCHHKEGKENSERNARKWNFTVDNYWKTLLHKENKNDPEYFF
jgi:hypothetical protein